MTKPEPRFVGVELYFEDLRKATGFYTDVLGLKIAEEESGHFAKFAGGSGFVCLERKGAESYPSRDKAVLFFEVDDLAARVKDLGQERFVQVEREWAVMHDPEGHNVLLLQRRS
jgi:catechol 2,3-dioxygenase-like lactoylglutathione lyase family enzyme